MGYIKHHAIVVTSSINELIKLAHEKAVSLFDGTVSELVKSGVNGYASFLIAPDGSKEGWPESEHGDERRKEFIEWVNSKAYEDGSNSISFSELFYGEDNRRSEIVDHN